MQIKKENFKDYVLGTYDGTPKTPEWAYEICGVLPRKIRALAREIAKAERVSLLTAWSASPNEQYRLLATDLHDPRCHDRKYRKIRLLHWRQLLGTYS